MNTLEAYTNIIGPAMVNSGLFDRQWRFEWSRSKRVFGACWYGDRTIKMSEALVELNDEGEIRDTILHEIAHALTPGHNHDFIWEMKAKELGARPERCYDSATVKAPPPKYIGTCLGCGVQINRYKLSKRVANECFHTVCRRAGKESRVEWRRGGQ